jgi:hypothetical protein
MAAYGCGTMGQIMSDYWSIQDHQEKQEFLLNQGCSNSINYSPLRDDQALLNIFANAVEIGLSNKTLIEFLDRFNCLYGQNNTPNYIAIKTFVAYNNLGSVCNDDRLSSSYVVNTYNGLNLRDKPDQSGSKIATIANGTLVEVLQIEGDWAYIDSYSQLGYVYLPFIKPLKIED